MAETETGSTGSDGREAPVKTSLAFQAPFYRRVEAAAKLEAFFNVADFIRDAVRRRVEDVERRPPRVLDVEAARGIVAVASATPTAEGEAP